jgi:glycosyltransferase involved in cell wall biosynthesis
MPLLSICIPTYNRASFLKVMLEALLPQLDAVGDDVEVWILDNASTDQTAAVVEAARTLGNFHYHRQPSNLGPIVNITQGPSELATGVFSWVVGDHNLFRPGAIARVISALRTRSHLQVFYANFRCADYPNHWPATALGGHDGAFSYLGNSSIQDGIADHWSHLIDAQSAACTQSYAHIVKTSVWQDYWRGQDISKPYTNGLSTYPHTWMLAETVFKQPAGRIAEPVLTIYNGAQSWNNPTTRAFVNFCGFPELIRLFKLQGLASDRIADLKQYNMTESRKLMHQLIHRTDANPWNDTWHYINMVIPNNQYLVLPLINEFCISGATRFSRLILVAVRLITAVSSLIRRTHTYLFHNCRPARWLRMRPM